MIILKFQNIIQRPVLFFNKIIHNLYQETKERLLNNCPIQVMSQCCVFKNYFVGAGSKPTRNFEAAMCEASLEPAPTPFSKRHWLKKGIKQ